jgi:serpin B
MKTILTILILAMVATGCAAPGVRPADAEALRSDVPRETDPGISDAELNALVEGNTAFAADLYQQLRGEEGNLFLSPHSISVALAMTYAGARGETAEQMADVLHFTRPDGDLHPAFNALDLRLTPPEDADEEAFALHIANSLWAEKDYTFREAFLDLLAEHYGAGLRLVSFKTAYEEARIAINEWVEEETEGRIEDLIPEGGVNELTRLVLANAIYFNAQWAHTFPEDNTKDGTFTTLEGSEVTVPMMRWSEPQRVPYAQGDSFQAVELPYLGGQASMVIIVPDAGQFADFERALTGAQLQGIVESLETRGVALTMPTFEYKAEFSLAKTLQAMGMTDAFSEENADFSGMDGTRELLITDVFHKAFVSVDEEGTEAAAATAVVVGIESMPPVTDAELTLDRPFVYLIRDTETGAVLFLGRVVDPS